MKLLAIEGISTTYFLGRKETKTIHHTDGIYVPLIISNDLKLFDNDDRNILMLLKHLQI
jgi:hypothetical protein